MLKNHSKNRSEELLFQSLRDETKSFEFSSENLQNNPQISDFDTNIITIIKEIERTPIKNYPNSSNSLILSQSGYKLMNEKQKLKKTGFFYGICFTLISFLHIFSAINIFVLLYEKEGVFKDVLVFGIVSLSINGFWIIANCLVAWALFKRDEKIMLYAIYVLSLALLSFIFGVTNYVYIMEREEYGRLGFWELFFLIFEGVGVIGFGFGANYFRIKIEKIKISKGIKF